MTWLLDGNLLVALTLHRHVHHERAHRWLTTIGDDQFATCPITEGTLLRLHMSQAADPSSSAAWNSLRAIHAHPRHLFWKDAFSYTEIPPDRLTGHHQLTDAWLAHLAHRNSAKLATLDEPLSALWPDSTLLIPV